MTVPPTARAELAERREFLLRSLRDLEAERAAGEISEPDYVALRDDYTAQAAQVLRALAASPPTSRPTPPPAPGAGNRSPRHGAAHPGRHRHRSLGITLGVALAVAAVTGGALAFFAAERPDGSPLSGSVPQGASQRVGEAIALEARGEALEALKLYDDVLGEDPDNVEALAYRGWLLKRAGLADEAMISLDRAVAIDPTYPDARFFRGMVLFQDRGDPAAAAGEFRAFLELGPPPEMVGAVQDVLRRAEAAAASATTAAPG